jgi:alkane 1-monooxygenase
MVPIKKVLPYFTSFILFILALMAFQKSGLWCWVPLIFTFGIIPAAEFLLKPVPSNNDPDQEATLKNHRIFDFILYAAAALHLILLVLFISNISSWNNTIDLAGRVVSMGILCGVFGINLAHELGHRTNSLDRTLSKVLLLTSLYMHFYIEHNKGHHTRVSTPDDPASARFGESIFKFWIRSITGSYLSAWHIAQSDAKKSGSESYFLFNEMLLFQIIQILFLAGIWYYFGYQAIIGFVVAAVIGALLLESVNYIEHYGLSRKITEESRFERVQPHHSWNSDHILGRWMLFELSRHSDHHFLASRKYQILKSYQHVPQMPTGYPGMILLAMVPPLWFKIMHSRINQYAH